MSGQLQQEVVRGNGKGLVSRADQLFEMAIPSDDMAGLRRDRAVHELVIVRVAGHDGESVVRLDEEHVSAEHE